MDNKNINWQMTNYNLMATLSMVPTTWWYSSM